VAVAGDESEQHLVDVCGLVEPVGRRRAGQLRNLSSCSLACSAASYSWLRRSARLDLGSPTVWLQYDGTD
jgi:hypothetical protein